MLQVATDHKHEYSDTSACCSQNQIIAVALVVSFEVSFEVRLLLKCGKCQELSIYLLKHALLCMLAKDYADCMHFAMMSQREG